MSDSELAALLGEPPRKRRAAAVAAQKNWQMLSAPEDDIIDDEDDLIITEHIVKQPINTTKIAENSNFIITNPVINRTSLPNNSIVIDLNRNKKSVVDRDYSPTQDLESQTNTPKVRQIIHPLKARKSFPTPLQNRPQIIPNKPQLTANRPQIITNRPKIMTNKTNIQNIQRVQIVNRVIPQETILIEGQTSKRVIVKTNDSSHYYRKPNVVKLVTGEPQDFPRVEGDVEEIIGTYSDDKEVKGIDDDIFEELSLILFCESETEISKNSGEKDRDDIEIIEIIDEKKTQNKPQNYSLIKSTHNTRLQTKPIKGEFDPIIGTLEMECDNFDDDFTDGLLIDCEEDILSEKQWKQSVDIKKEYMDYTKSLLTAKNVKFLPEDQVTEAIGIVTTTISETTRIVTNPVPAPPTLRIRKMNPIQSIRTPIPSLVNQMTSQRSQGMRTMVAPPQISTANRMPITLIPVSSSTGVNTNSLILAPPQGFVNSTGLSGGLGFILQGGLPNRQPTYLMLPPSSVSNSISPQNIIISNGSAVCPQNIINPSTNQSIQLTNALQTQYRPRFVTQTVTRPVMPTAYRTPLSRPVVTINRTPTNSGLRLQTYSNANKPNVIQNVVTNQYLDCLTIFKGTPDSTKKITMRTVLTIKPLPFSWPSNIDDLINSLIKLDNALMKEKFKESPISWMVSAKLIVPPKCKSCRTGICNKVSKTLNAKNEFWHCNTPNCNKSYPIERPRIFNGLKFDIPVSKLLFLIYYWSIQVDVEDLIKTGQIEMGTEKIYNVWSRLQKVCSTALQVKDGKLTQLVEVCSIQVGRFQVLGAMEVRSSRTKLAVIPISDISGLSQTNGKRLVMAPFVKWLEKGAQIMTCEPKFQALVEYGFKVTLQSKNAFLAANKNLSLTSISGYLIHHLQRFFKDFELTCLTNDILGNILDELLWRERFGTDPFSAFYNIIKHISEQCGLKKYETSILIAPPLSAPSVIRNRNVGKRTGPTVAETQSRPAVPVAPVLDETNSIFVDEYYYSSLTLKTIETQTTSQEESVKDSIQCHLCQMFFDNILIVKHLLEHLEKERRGRVRKGDNNESECKHCLRFFSNRALHLHEELANLKVIPFSCRICLLPLLARQPFIGHMKTCHFSGEMPYYCDICCYRSSFQKSLLDHFISNHSNSSQVMCHYCIRVFDVTKFKNFSSFLYRHLTTHYAVASVYDCDKCSLTFTTKLDLKEHCFKGHNPSNSVDDKFEITPYVVTNEEKLLSIRAKEQELFTPFLPIADQNVVIPTEMTDHSEAENISCEISCEPNISDFLSIEPEIEINLIDTNSSAADFILPVDCDYTNDHLKHILTNSFDTTLSEEVSKTEEHIEGVEPNSDSAVEATPEPSPEFEKDYILSNDQKVVCIECKTQITTDHFKSKMVCEKCYFTTHCKIAFDGHNTNAHKDSFKQNKQISVLRDFPELIVYKTVCKVCGFCATDGNQFALHMIESNHFKPICKPLDFEHSLEV